MRLLRFGLVILGAFMMNTAASADPFFKAQSHMLKNGMQVLFIQNLQSPAILVSVCYKVGSADESPLEPRGLAHFFEHMMFRGTTNYPHGEYDKLIKRYGAIANAMTWMEGTVYFAIAANQHFDMLLKLEADRMVNLDLKDEHVLPERDAVLNERLMRYENADNVLLNEQADAAFHVHHPYGVPSIGWMHDIRAYNAEHAKNFYKRWYKPSNAILLIIGNTKLEEVVTLAEKHFGKLPTEPETPRTRLVDPEPTKVTKRLTLESGQTKTPELTFYYEAPCLRSEDKAHAYPLEVLQQYMVSDKTGKIYRMLVEEQKVAAGISMSYQPFTRDNWQFVIQMQPADGVSPIKAEAALTAAIQKVLKDGVPDQEVEKAKARIQAHLAYVSDDIQSLFHFMCWSLCAGYDVREIEAYGDNIAKVKPAEVMAAAKRFFSIAPRVVTALMPLKDASNEQAQTLPTSS